MAETEELEQDPRFPGGMNYLDWVMNVLKADEHSPLTLKAIVQYERKARASYESGVKPKKSDSGPKIDLVSLGLIKVKPKLVRRNVT
jgi:hypothetical protein